ncbi:nop14-like family protein [Ophiostoma piceae UAMH 11346]|uniref:Nop14-like family protein n=1 Tax=Ophiostoma piceae (strain UAMH 11346) TaxID=1262450 RepID=S3BRZ0_OPHP1|nr:nop14-like family protein [Ophiostoma piceae UAMH 11346]
MAGSQLKRLKASLLDQGIIGPQKSKKQKKQAAEEARAAAANGGGNGNTKRLKRSDALDTIREQFNPFQFKMNARGPKFPVTSLKSAMVPESLRGIKGRPQAALSRSEEKRRSTLLIDMQRRNKVGGILDRRLGEGDPNMTPEERALERFAFEKQRIHNKKGAVFDLEGGEDEFLAGPGDGGLTHGGKTLAFGGGSDDEDVGMRDDFDEREVSDDDGDDDGEIGHKKQLKRLRSELGLTEELTLAALEQPDGEDGAPERKKSKKEVMEEVIAKSKYHKYERQITKEADDDVRAALDNMLPEITQLLASGPSRSKDANKDKDTLTTKVGGAFANEAFDKAAFEKTYDVRLRQLLQDKKAEPSQRTKTEEEVAADQSEHLKKLEESRVRRMMGQISYEDGDGDGSDKEDQDKEEKEKKKKKDAEAKLADGPALQFIRADGAEEDEFGLGQGIKTRHTAAELGFDDEDDFLIDDDLVASGSEVEPDSDEDEDDENDESDDEDGSDAEDDEDDEFIRGILTEDEKKNAVFVNAGKLPATANQGSDDDGVPYTFICPQTHAELLSITEDIPVAKLPVVVQRIRALYHPKLDHGNKDRLGRFAAVLVEHIAYLASQEQPPFATIESVVRHIHSLAKSVPIEVAVAFRSHLADMEGVVVTHTPGEKGVLSLEAKTKSVSRSVAFNTGDLIVLTAIATTFPTSDHFHQVVTPAMLAMGRYLEQSTPRTLADYATGLYVCTLTCQYQQLSKRYVPELVNYVLNTLVALSPGESANVAANKKSALFGGRFPIHTTARGVRIEKAHKHKDAVRKLRLSDCINSSEPPSTKEANQLKLALFSTALSLISEFTTMWSTSSPSISSSASGTAPAADAASEDASKTKTVKGSGGAALYETLEPIRAVLTLLKTKACRSELPAGSAKDIDRVSTQVDAAQRFAHLARRPLELHHHRPMAIRTFVPRFEAEYDPDKHYDPNRERADASKLKAEFKRERKGAMRELRKDAHFMQREKLKIKKTKDAAYEKKYKRLVAEIQGTEGREANAYERERAARKRR